jgi:hypothetical protein
MEATRSCIMLVGKGTAFMLTLDIGPEEKSVPRKGFEELEPRFMTASGGLELIYARYSFTPQQMKEGC